MDLSARTRCAAMHEYGGGDRPAYLEGWDWGKSGGGLFRAMKTYADGSQQQKSFISGWMDADNHATASAAPS